MMDARLFNLARETAHSEETLVEIERLLGREIETRHVYAAEAFAAAMGMSLAEAVHLLRDSPEQLAFLFSVDEQSLAFERDYAVNPYNAFIDQHPEALDGLPNEGEVK